MPASSHCLVFVQAADMQKLKLDQSFSLVKAYNQSWAVLHLWVYSSERKEWTQQISWVFCCLCIFYVIQSISTRNNTQAWNHRKWMLIKIVFLLLRSIVLINRRLLLFHEKHLAFTLRFTVKPVWNHNIADSSALLCLTLDWYFCDSYNVSLNAGLILLYNFLFYPNTYIHHFLFGGLEVAVLYTPVIAILYSS